MERGALDRLVGRLASHGQNAFIAFLVIAVFVRVAVLDAVAQAAEYVVLF